MLIDRDTLERIDRKKLRLEEKCEYRSNHCSLVVDGLVDQALENSYLLEEGHLLEKQGSHKEKKRARAMVKQGKENLKMAWKFAKLNYDGEFTPRFIMEIAEIIEPEKVSGYRNGGVMMQGTSIIPIRPEKIDRDMGALLEVVNAGDLHPVENASLLHLHVSRIQPFNDGNKRTSRVLANLVLSHEDYAPLLIKESERTLYQHILFGAWKGYKGREGDIGFEYAWCFPEDISPTESVFHEFNAVKVSEVLDTRLRDSQPYPEFKVTLKGHDHNHAGYVLGAKRKLHGIFRGGIKNGQVKVVDRKRGVLVVRGDLCEKSIASALDSKAYTGRYDIEKI